MQVIRPAHQQIPTNTDAMNNLRYAINTKPGKRTPEEIEAASWENHNILKEAPELVAWAIKHGLMKMPKFKPQPYYEETDTGV